MNDVVVVSFIGSMQIDVDTLTNDMCVYARACDNKVNVLQCACASRQYMCYIYSHSSTGGAALLIAWLRLDKNAVHTSYTVFLAQTEYINSNTLTIAISFTSWLNRLVTEAIKILFLFIKIDSAEKCVETHKLWIGRASSQHCRKKEAKQCIANVLRANRIHRFFVRTNELHSIRINVSDSAVRKLKMNI